MPFLFEAAILSRMRSPVTSRSNWAKEKSTFRVSRPMLVRGVELLGDGDERDPMLVEQLDELREIGERAGQAIDLVDDDDVDPAVQRRRRGAPGGQGAPWPPEKPPSS